MPTAVIFLKSFNVKRMTVLKYLKKKVNILYKMKIIERLFDNPRVGGTPYNGLYREVPPKRGTFFSLEVL